MLLGRFNPATWSPILNVISANDQVRNEFCS
jgi:hypothetical protein